MPFTVTCDECKQTFSLTDDAVNEEDMSLVGSLIDELVEHIETHDDETDDEDSDDDEE